MTLAEFLIARIEEDEAVARAAAAYLSRLKPGTKLGAGLMSEHHVRWQPARALAECEAKRLVMTWHSQYNSTGCGDDGTHGREDECPTLRALARPYATHPDFDPAWSN